MAGSRIVSHARWWLIALPLLLLIVMPMVPSDDAFRHFPEEEAANARWIGQEVHDKARATATTRFRAWFVDSGVARKSYTMFIKDGGKVIKAEDGMRAATKKWLDHFWMGVYRALYRWEVAWMWYAGLFFFALAAAIDGWVVKNVKSTEFGYSNPLNFHLAVHMLIVMIGLAFVIPFLPIPIGVLVWPSIALIFAGTVWLIMSEFQTGA